MNAEDLSQEQALIGNFEDQDPGVYIEEALKRIDNNFTRLFAAVEELSTTLNPDSTGWRVFVGGGVTYRVGTDTDGYFKIQQALTALGFNGTESTDEGDTGDYITLIPYKFGTT
jgi:hypothetical protein